MTFSWAVEEGEVFIFDISVTGNISTGTITLPPQLAPMNNTRIAVEIASLPNVTIIFYGSDFIETVVEHLKTSSTFANGTIIPVQYYSTINSHVSSCILPIGGWSHLDFFFPNYIDRPFLEHDSYLSASSGNYFYFGHSSNSSNRRSEWHGIIDLITGVPKIVTFSDYHTNPPWTYIYNVTIRLVS
jgi:hypothetical protein